MGGERVMCKHLYAAREFFLDQILTEYVAMQRRRKLGALAWQR